MATSEINDPPYSKLAMTSCAAFGTLVTSFAAMVVVLAGCDTNPANQEYLDLFGAAKLGDVAQIRARLKEGDDPNKDNNGVTPLFRASTKSVAEVLIDAGADVNFKTTRMEPPIYFAQTTGVTPLCDVSSSEVASVLIEHGASVDSTDSGGRLPLHYQSGWGNVEVMRVLLANRCECDASSSDGGTPLMVAAANGKREAMRLLIEAGADVNRQDANGWTPLHHAAHLGWWNAIRDLLDKGADPAIRNNSGDDIFGSLSKGYLNEGPLPPDLEEILRRPGKVN